MKKNIYLALCIVFTIIFIGSSAGLGMTLYKYRQADKLYDDLRTRCVARLPGGTQQPEQSEEAPIIVDFDALLQENSDIVGWLYCEDTPIDYPVVQSDDNDYYLRRDLNGNYLSAGTLFVDYRCSAVGTGQNHIIYGHNMKNRTMFGTMSNYKEQSYYDDHPVLYYLTPGGNYKIELFAGLITESDSEVYTPQFGSSEEFEVFLRNIKEKSTFSSDITVRGDDNIVTLSTCSYEFNNARYVVFGKLTGLSAANM